MRRVVSFKSIKALFLFSAGVAVIGSLFLYNKGYGMYLDGNRLPKIGTFTKSPIEKVNKRGKTYYCIETWDDYFQMNRNWVIKPKELLRYERDEEAMIRNLYNEIKE